MAEPKYTGMICPSCKGPVAFIANIVGSVLMMRCPACNNSWSADAPTSSDKTV